MDLVEQDNERDVVEYDFMFVGGQKLAITLDAVAGDTIADSGDTFSITTTAKPGLTDPDEVIAAETLTIYKQHLTVVARCERKQRVPTQEELFNMRKVIHKLTSSIQ